MLVKLGYSKKYNSTIYLSDFKWACKWYWSGGYLGNKGLHYHLDSYISTQKNMYDALRDDFGDTMPFTDSQFWLFCDLFKQFYAYKEAAECAHRGHAGYTAQQRDPQPELAKQLNSYIEHTIIPAIRKLCADVA